MGPRPDLSWEAELLGDIDVFVTLLLVERLSYKHHQSIKKLMASELRQDIGAEIPAGIEGILGNKVMGDVPWKAEETDI